MADFLFCLKKMVISRKIKKNIERLVLPVSDSVYRILRKKKSGKSIQYVEENAHLPNGLLGDIETGKKDADPEDIVALSKFYDSRRLCRWYCSNECPVGKHLGLIKVNGTGTEEMGLIILEIIASLNKLNKIDLERIVEIAKDGIIDESEATDFNRLKDGLQELAQAYGSLLRWEEDGNIIGVPKA